MTGRVGRIRGTGETGISLLEVVVAMSIMSIVMAVFTTGFISMYRSANRTGAMAVAQSQVTIAFERLDKEVRYASAISEPGVVGTDSYVEYLTTVTGTASCAELRLDRTDPADVRLRLRRWDQGSQPPAWTASPVLASNLSPAEPFSLVNGSAFQRLRLALDVGGGARTDVTFTALNSSSAMAAGYRTICAEGRSHP